jgi:signal transduction histidine kinase
MVIALLLVYLLHKRQSISRIDSLLDERLAERKRLARDLNDSFLQTVEASKLLADNALSKYNDVAEMRKAMEKLSEWLGQAAEEGKSALDSLRDSTESRNELAEAFHRATQERAAPDSMEVTFSLASEAQEMHPIVRDEIYRIGYEAIRNAYMHSRATQLHVDLQYGRDLFLRIVDNGLGFDPGTPQHGRQAQSGLRRMREGAARIGGELTMSSSASGGTEVRLLVPGTVIFQKSVRLFRRPARHRAT